MKVRAAWRWRDVAILLGCLVVWAGSVWFGVAFHDDTDSGRYSPEMVPVVVTALVGVVFYQKVRVKAFRRPVVLELDDRGVRYFDPDGEPRPGLTWSLRWTDISRIVVTREDLAFFTIDDPPDCASAYNRGWSVPLDEVVAELRKHLPADHIHDRRD